MNVMFLLIRYIYSEKYKEKIWYIYLIYFFPFFSSVPWKIRKLSLLCVSWGGGGAFCQRECFQEVRESAILKLMLSVTPTAPHATLAAPLLTVSAISPSSHLPFFQPPTPRFLSPPLLTLPLPTLSFPSPPLPNFDPYPIFQFREEK